MRDLYKLAGLKRFENDLETLRAAAETCVDEKDHALIEAILCDTERKQAYDQALKTVDLVESIELQITDDDKVSVADHGGRNQPPPGQTNPAGAIVNDSGRRLLTTYGVIFGLLFLAAGWLSLKSEYEHIETASPDEQAVEIASEVEIIDIVRKRYYVTAEILNMRRWPSTRSPVVGQLKRYDDLTVEFPTAKEGWGRVFTESGVEGYVSLQFVAPGDGRAAFREYCAQSVIRPPSGNLAQIASGGHQRVKVEAPLTHDVAVRLVNRTGNMVLMGYVRAGEAYSFDGISAGRYQLEIAAGNTFSEECGFFTETMGEALFTRSLMFEPALVRSPDARYQVTVQLKDQADSEI